MRCWMTNHLTGCVADQIWRMLQKAPQSIKVESEALDKRRVTAFKKAVAAFANSSGGEDKADEEDDSD